MTYEEYMLNQRIDFAISDIQIAFDEMEESIKNLQKNLEKLREIKK